MKKRWLYSTAILSLLAVGGCGKSNLPSNSTKSEQSTKTKEDWISKAQTEIEHENFNKAKEDLTEAEKDKGSNNKAKAMLSQIEKYQSAKDAFYDEQYDKAKQLIDEGVKVKDGSDKMNTHFDQLSKDIQQKQNEKHEKKVAGQQKDKATTENGLYTAKGLSDAQKDAINQQMQRWCHNQAAKGGMKIIEAAVFPPGTWMTGKSYAYASTVDGPVMLIEGSRPGLGCYMPTSGNINTVGGALFYFPEPNGEVVGPNNYQPEGLAKMGSDIHYYLWADNGKVYELIDKITGHGEGQDLYNASEWSQGGDTVHRQQNGQYIVSEDAAAQAEYQRLLKEAHNN